MIDLKPLQTAVIDKQKELNVVNFNLQQAVLDNRKEQLEAQQQ